MITIRTTLGTSDGDTNKASNRRDHNYYDFETYELFAQNYVQDKQLLVNCLFHNNFLI